MGWKKYSMNTTEIIAAFELYVDDTTELSTAQELQLLNKMYQRICDLVSWEFLKKEASGTMASTTTITVPTDFGYFVDNRLMTDNSDDFDQNARPVGILINGTKWLQIINWSDRRQYNNVDGYAYYDARQGTIVTTYPQGTGATYSFDYKMVPSDLTAGQSPAFPSRFHPMIYHAMAVDDMIIQLFDKARSYAQENAAQYASYLADMKLWNANLQNY